MSHVLQQQLDAKRNELRVSTNVLLAQVRKSKSETNANIVRTMADRNRRECEYEIDCILDQIKLTDEINQDRKTDIEKNARHKTACYKLLADHTVTTYDITKRIYERVQLPNGVIRVGLFEKIKNNMTDGELKGEYELSKTNLIYKRLLNLYDLQTIDEPDIKVCIFDLYNLALTLPHVKSISKFIDIYITQNVV